MDTASIAVDKALRIAVALTIVATVISVARARSKERK